MRTPSGSRAVAVRATLLLLPLLALGAAPPAPRATDVVLRGVVTTPTREPIAGASVSTTEPRAGATTDAAGRYLLRIPGGRGRELTLHVRRIGFQVSSRRLRLDADTVTSDFTLALSTVALSELVTLEYKRSVASAPAAVRLRGVAGGTISAPGGRRDERRNTEEYAAIDENAYADVRSRPRSTFSVDVDRASYSNVRRFVMTERRLPPRDAVRIEELVNYFPYDYAEPRGREPIAVHAEVTRAPWNRAHLLARVALQTPRIPLADLPPNNLVFLLDVSGSMQPANKLPLVKQAMRLLVNELRPVDRVAIVVYAGAAGTVLPSTPASERERILEAIERLEAGGSTAGGEGIRLAYDVARANHMIEGNNRVILATDGDFNVGVSSTAELVRLVEEKRRQGTFLTVLGFGMGNYKDSRLEQLADRGNGNYAYVDDLMEARKTLVHELGGTLVTVAKDVKLQVEFNPRAVAAYRLIGYENRLLRDEDFDDDGKDAGEMGAGHSVTALYELIPVGLRDADSVRRAAPLRYQEPRSATTTAARSDELLHVSLRYKTPTGESSRLLRLPVTARAGRASTDLTFAAAVASYGMLLRESKHAGAFTYDAVRELARSSLGPDRDGYRAGFVKLVEETMRLSRDVARRE
ncbi:MAG TPA: von Willebrand factor type A domain-containing protein [Gemmatimonadaceae bacterium]|nr:von Willebrand factor type A domain-containing protein [Gemmatimonadaceae bacterium]